MAMRLVFAMLFLQMPFAAGLQTEKTSPVTKVITMLKDMTTQLAKEQEVDDEMYSKMDCWCTTGSKEKTKAIFDGEDKIASLKVVIEEETAAVAQFTGEISQLEAQLAKSKTALAQ